MKPYAQDRWVSTLAKTVRVTSLEEEILKDGLEKLGECLSL
jgi:hypothetical protein